MRATSRRAYGSGCAAVKLANPGCHGDIISGQSMEIRLLGLPVLYRLPAVADVWTPRARANLTAELTLLRSRGASAPATPPPAAD